MKLSLKLILTFLFILLLSIGTLSVSGVLIMRSSLENNIGAEQLLLAKSTMKQIDWLMYERVQDINSISEDEEFEGFLSNRGNLDNSRAKLKELIFLTGPWYELDIFNKEGILVVSSEEDEISQHIDQQDSTERLAFETAMRGKTYVSDLIISEDFGKPTLIFAAPVRDELSSGQPIVGVVVGNLEWPVITDILDGIDTLHVHLLNSEGLVLAENSRRHELELNNKISKELLEDFSQTRHSNIHQHGLDIEEETLTSVAIQQGHLAYQGNGWILVLEIPTREAFSPVLNIVKQFVILALILILVGILIAFYMGGSITKPILKLKYSAESISRGNFDETIEVSGKDEIGELAETFDNMRYTLKMVIDEYEQMKSGVKSTPKLNQPKNGKPKTKNKK